MIQQRLDFAYRRRQIKRHEPVSPAASIYATEDGLKIPECLVRSVPRATIETFNVIVLYYFAKQNWAHINHLHKMLRPAEIHMSSFFMNHLIQTELQLRNQQGAWRAFTKYARAVSPDMDTYDCLWTAEVRHTSINNGGDPRGFPVPRQLFAVMRVWMSSMDEKQRATARDSFSLDLYGKIIHSFCSQRDFAGCLVAIHALAQDFGHYPDHNIARTMTTAVSNIPEPVAPVIRTRRGRQHLPASQARLKNTTSVLSALSQRRTQAAMEHGVELEKMDPQARLEENMNLLSEFIRVVLVRSLEDVENVEPEIERAAQEMGAPGIRTGDVDASNVS